MKLKTAASFACYSISGAIQALIGFLLLPIISSSLGIAAYGEYTIIVSITTIASTISFLGMGSALSRFYYIKESLHSKRSIFSFCLCMTLLGGCIQYLLFHSYSILCLHIPALSPLVPANELILPSIYSSVLGVSNYISVVFRLERKPVHALLYALSLSFINILALQITLVHNTSPSLSLIFSALLYSTLLHLVFAMFILLPRRLTLVLSDVPYDAITSYGIKSLIASFAGQLFLTIDLLSAQYFLDGEQLGTLSAVLKIGTVFTLLCTSPASQIWPFYVYERIHSEEISHVSNLAVNTYISFSTAASILMSFIFCLFQPILVTLSVPENVYSYFFLVCNIGMLNGMITFTTLGWNVSCKVERITVLYLLTVPLKLFLVCFLGRHFAFLGVLFGSLISVLIFNILAYKSSARYLDYLIDQNQFFKHLVPVTSIFIFSFFLIPSYQSDGKLFIISVALLLVMYLFYLYFRRGDFFRSLSKVSL